MTNKRKGLALALSLALCLVAAPVTALADDALPEEGVAVETTAVDDGATPEASGTDEGIPAADDQGSDDAGDDVVSTEPTDPADPAGPTDPANPTDPEPTDEPATEPETGWVVGENGEIGYVDPETGEQAAGGEYEIEGFCAPTGAASTTITDVTEETPHGGDVQWLFETGVSTGWPTGEGTAEFRPGNTVIRQDMAAFLYRMAGSPDYTPSDETVSMFTDVTMDTPHALEIWWLADTQITRGFSESDGTYTFRPTNTVIRQDMAAFLYRLAGVSGYEPTDEEMAAFTDVTASTPHHNEIWWLASMGVTRGFEEEDGTLTFRPTNRIVRQDMAAFLHRMVEGGVTAPTATHEYLFDDDGNLVNGWTEVDGEARFYDHTTGARVESGWVRDGSDKSYIDPETKELLKDGQHVICGSTFLFDEDGYVTTGWVDLEQGRCFFNRSNGVMLTDGIHSVDGSKYCFGSNGALKYGWQKVSEGWCYADATTGKLLTNGINEIDGDSYYFRSTGIMGTGWLTQGGKSYFFDRTSGKMAKSCFRDVDGATYYFGADGAIYKNGTYIIDGGAYRIASNGKVYSSITGTNNAKLDEYIQWIIVNKCGTTGEAGLRAAYNYIRSCPYISSSHTYDTHWQNWAPTFALQFKAWGGGNCYRYASTMTYTAIALGYNAIARTGLCNNVNDHGWCEITMADGSHRVIDCSLGNSHAYPALNWFMVRYENARVAYYTLGHVCLDYY